MPTPPLVFDNCSHPSQDTGCEDYINIAQAIEFFDEHTDRSPLLEDVAAHIKLNDSEFEQLFIRWAGVKPKYFFNALSLDRLLSTLHCSHELALNTHTHTHTHKKSHLFNNDVPSSSKKAVLFSGRTDTIQSIQYGEVSTVFGKVFIAATLYGICRLTFLDATTTSAELAQLKKQWPNASITECRTDMQQRVDAILSITGDSANKSDTNSITQNDIQLHVSGTDFQLNVWNALLQIPTGQLFSYRHIAHAINKPKALRAIGTAIGSNPVGILIPCHRVIRQTGHLGGYRWGLTRKKALIARELSR